MQKTSIAIATVLIIAVVFLYGMMTNKLPVKKHNNPKRSYNKADLNRWLLKASSDGNIDVMDSLLGKGADINAQVPREKGWTTNDIPLLASARAGKTRAVEYLIDHGANLNSQANEPVGHKNQGNTALMEAAAYGRTAVMKILLAHGANPNIKNEWGRNAMSLAIESCSIPAITTLRHAGVSIRDAAAAKGMRFAIDSNDDSSAQEHKIYKTIEYLLANGADPNARGFEDFGERKTVLMIASGMGHGREGGWVECPSVVKLLLSYGADPNLKDENGETALSAAAKPEIIRMLKLAIEKTSGKASHNQDFAYYDNGRFITKSWASLKASENCNVKGGHQPWRQDPIAVAVAMTSNFLPTLPRGESIKQQDKTVDNNPAIKLTTPKWNAEYIETQKQDNEAYVDMYINRELSYLICLKRPLGREWYITTFCVR